MTDSNILVVQLRQLGDILLTTPCLRQIRNHRPQANISFLAHPMGEKVLKGNPFVDEIYYYDPKDFLSDFVLIKQLRGKKFDLVLDFMSNPRSALYTYLSGATHSVAFKSRRAWLYNNTIENLETDRYIVHQKYQLLRAAGIKVDRDINLDLPWNESDSASTQKEFASLESTDRLRLRVFLSPTHRREVRRWPLQNYIELSDHFSKNWNALVYWLWGPGEFKIAKECQERTQSHSILAPALNFREIAAFIANGDLFVGNSNGLSHIAVAVNTCSFQIHGPTKLSSWCPLSENHLGIEGIRGNISEIQLEEVVRNLDEMRPVILKKFEERMAQGFKSNWR